MDLVDTSKIVNQTQNGGQLTYNPTGLGNNNRIEGSYNPCIHAGFGGPALLPDIKKIVYAARTSSEPNWRFTSYDPSTGVKIVI